MEYTCELIIDLPRDRVIELFDSSENLSKWQPGLQEFEHIIGEPGQAGAKSRMVYDENGRRIEMIEIILNQNFPDECSATYEATGVFNRISNHFYDEGENKTRWVMESEFQFSGVYKLMGLFMKGSFPKETIKQMNSFKTFAEST